MQFSAVLYLVFEQIWVQKNNFQTFILPLSEQWERQEDMVAVDKVNEEKALAFSRGC